MKNNNFLVVLSLALFFSGCKNSDYESNSTIQKTPEELRMELKLQEQQNPTDYLTVDSKMNDSIVQTRSESFFHRAEYKKDGYVIKGQIKNTASVARFKDVVLTVHYYSATETEIKSEDYVIYEYYEPNKSKSFAIHVYAPDAMKSFGVTVKDANAVN